jgi:hypothetical protein
MKKREDSSWIGKELKGTVDFIVEIRVKNKYQLE